MLSQNTLQEGNIIPSIVFKFRTRNTSNDENPFEWMDVTTEELFKNKRCILFALPGAFTPICSSYHLPNFEKMYPALKQYNIDEIYCLSVNDAFVMRKWGLDQNLPEDKTPYSLGFKNVKLIPDGACLFTRAMGMSCTWTSERGFGERSWRYSAIINDMKIEKLFVEEPMIENSKDDPYEVSSVENMLKYLVDLNGDTVINLT